MSGITLRAGFDDNAITRHLARLALLDQQGFDGVRREIGEYMKGDIQDNLDGQTLFDGTPMPQSKAAIARKGKTLIHRHHLYDDYTYNLVGTGLEVGSPLVYAAIHHHGGDRAIPSKRGPVQPLPARPVMGIGPRQEAAIGNFLIAEIQKAQR